MDLWQAARQLAEELLAKATWNPGDVVLTGGAVVTEDLEGNLLTDQPPSDKALVPPFARVVPVSFEKDEDCPGRGTGLLRVFVTAGDGGVFQLAPNLNDAHGLAQETGAARDLSAGVIASQQKSQGRSTDEVLARLLEVLGPPSLPGQLVDSIHGFQGEARRCEQRIATDGVQVLTRAFEVEVHNLTLSRSYPNVRGFKGTNAGAGVVNFLWINGPERFDSWDVLVARGTNPGDPAPTTPAGGSVVPITSATTAQATGLVTGHTYNVSVFRRFAETTSAVAANTPDRWSAAFSIAVNT